MAEAVAQRPDEAPPTASTIPARSQARQALADLRAVRAARRTEDVDRFDVFYRAYLASLLGAGLALWAVHLAGGHRLSAALAADTVRRAPGVCGLLTAVVVAVALRSGSRGGPLVVEAADVRHVLFAPVPRGVALRGPALRQLRFFAFVASLVGAVGGLFVARRAGGPIVAWLVCGAAWAVLTVALGVGAGWLAAGRRLRPWAATAIGGALVAWSAAGLRAGVPGPFTVAGRLVVWPVHVDLWALSAVAGAAVVLGLGLRQLGDVSVEALERRSALVGQLRFAATVRDLRTVLVLRRQLAQERARSRPWLRLPPLPWPTVTRGIRSALRAPAARVVRTMLVALVAAACGWAAWSGTTPLVALGGLAGFVAGLDVVEPLAEELDHPAILELAAVTRDHVLGWHLVVPAVQLAVCGVLVVGAVALAGIGAQGVAVAAACTLSALVCGLTGAAVSTVKGAPDLLSESTYNVFLPPEAASAMLLYRTAFPPAIATAGFVPVLVARHALAVGGDPVTAAWRSALVVAGVVAVGLVGWLRFRDGIHRAVGAAMGGDPAAGRG